MNISLDAMGGDVGPRVVVEAAASALERYDHLNLILVGDRDQIDEQLRTFKVAFKAPRLIVQHTSQVVTMDESPSQALRRKKDSSMRVAIDWVQQKKADACVSAGNTGALMATAHMVLKTLPGVDRSAIISAFPTLAKKPVYMLDLGANVDCSPHHLYQFGVMGSELVAAVGNISSPRVGLLNVGVEAIKGSDDIKAASRLLENCSALNYVGYVEGNDIFGGHLDVVVCSGFVGNMVLKSCEGFAKLFVTSTREAFMHSLWSKMVGYLACPILTRGADRLDPRRYNGANLLGLRGIVIKSHGGADSIGFLSAIEAALHSAEKRLPALIENRVAKILQFESSTGGQ